SLEIPISSLLGGSSRRVPFHQIKLTYGRVTVGTIRQFTRQTASTKYVLPLYHLSGFLGRVTGLCSENNFSNNDFCFPWMLFQPYLQYVGNRTVHCADYVRVPQF